MVEDQVRLRFAPDAPSSVIDSSNFTYLGYFRTPADPTAPDGTVTRFGFSKGAIAGRYVGGVFHLFITQGTIGNGYLAEIIPPGTYSNQRDTTPHILAAPIATLYANWGNVYDSKAFTFTGTLGVYKNALFWDEPNQQLWIAYGDGYSNNVPAPSVMFVTLGGTPAAPTHTSYGPWGTTIGQGHSNSYMTFAPTSVSTYLGSRMCFAGTIASGNASSPWGISMQCVAAGHSLPTTSTPADVIDQLSYSTITTKALTAFSIANPQTSHADTKLVGVGAIQPPPSATTTAIVHTGDTTIPVSDTSIFHSSGEPAYQHNDGMCVGCNSDGTASTGFQTIFYGTRSTTSGAGNLTGVTGVTADIASGTTIYLGKYDYNRGPTSARTDDLTIPWRHGVFNSIDLFSAAAWINLPSGKQGTVFFGNMEDTISGVDYGLPDIQGETVNHHWYTDWVTRDVFNQVCTFCGATGDGTGSLVPEAWVYDQRDFVSVARDLKDPLTLTEVHKYAMADLAPMIARSVGSGQLVYFGGAVFDDTTGLLYLSEQEAETATIGGEPRPFIHVFHVQ